MKKIAIIGGGRCAEIFAIHAHKMGIETHCFSLEKGIVNKLAFDYLHFVNILNRDEVLSICKEIGIDAIVATTELTIAVVAYVAEKLKLNAIPLDTAEKITDKYHNRVITEKIEDLAKPKYKEVNTIDEIKESHFDFPIILKPTAKGGKRGVVVVNKIEDLDESFEYALNGAGGQLPIIVEEFIDGGMECSVESLSYKGKNYIIQVTQKCTSGAPHCVELAHHQPANISKEIRNKVEHIVDEILTKLGIEYGPAHTEIKIKDNKVYLIECNARPGGDHIAYPLTILSTGYDYFKGAIEIALDEFKGIDTAKLLSNASGVVFVTNHTKEYENLFNNVEKYEWCYKKNFVSNKLQTIEHNDGCNINYFIYNAKEKPNFEDLIERENNGNR